MDETFPSSDQNELSPEDQAVLDAFLAMEDWEPTSEDADTPGTPPVSPSAPQPADATSEEYDMLLLFATEAEEDIGRMRQAVAQLEQNDRVDAPTFETLHRVTHKLKGTAGSIGCDSLSAIARHIEMVIRQIKRKDIAYGTGLLALTHAVQALETTLESIVSSDSENQSPRIELEEEYKALTAGIADPQELGQPAIDTEVSTRTPVARVDTRHLDQLMLHTEQMLELHAPLENAQKQVEAALAELHNAQTRLRRLETMYNPFASRDAIAARGMLGEQPASSLIERILRESVQRTGRVHKPGLRSGAPSSGVVVVRPNSHYPPGQNDDTSNPYAPLWDDMEVDRFTESNVLAISLREAITDVATAAVQLRLAFAQLNTLLKQQAEQTVQIRNDALSLRAAPFSVLVEPLRSTIQALTAMEKRAIQFEISGETTEIDQDILDALAHPLQELVRGSVTESLLASKAAHQPGPYAGRITLAAHASGNEVTIEAGFSMPVPGGTVEAINNAIAHLHGSIAPRRGFSGGIAFLLRFPRSQGMVQGLLARVGNQSIVVPYSQVHHIDYNRQALVAANYDLNELLGFPSARGMSQAIAPWLVLSERAFQLAVQVDEILGPVELMMKPLTAYLRRPGILGTAIDGTGNVLLVVDLPELITHRENGQKQKEPVKVSLPAGQARFLNSPEPAYWKILIADDSVSMRQSVRQILERVGYQLYEAHDGMEALEQILEQLPDVLLLDIEMPNLNGFDLLTILRASPLLSKVKTILLTSRSSDKHRQRAFELGAQNFLTKPCPPDELLEIVQSVLAS
ncbi:MAG TPA: response regulator [Ktedonobacteraceae bacterium]|nr:response regulator [Ktedonobacteraceae bacterium]